MTVLIRHFFSADTNVRQETNLGGFRSRRLWRYANRPWPAAPSSWRLSRKPAKRSTEQSTAPWGSSLRGIRRNRTEVILLDCRDFPARWREKPPDPRKFLSARFSTSGEWSTMGPRQTPPKISNTKKFWRLSKYVENCRNSRNVQKIIIVSFFFQKSVSLFLKSIEFRHFSKILKNTIELFCKTRFFYIYCYGQKYSKKNYLRRFKYPISRIFEANVTSKRFFFTFYPLFSISSKLNRSHVPCHKFLSFFSAPYWLEYGIERFRLRISESIFLEMVLWKVINDGRKIIWNRL